MLGVVAGEVTLVDGLVVGDAVAQYDLDRLQRRIACGASLAGYS
jgi:hypothetical protein